jgi:hypothetical protein
VKRYIVLGILGMLSGGGGGYAIDHGAYATGVSLWVVGAFAWAASFWFWCADE